jgi:peptidoglycan/LPS O-acetylase OafA/YrhL
MLSVFESRGQQVVAYGVGADNSFDALRLLAAYSVLFAHHFDLTKNAGPSLFGVGFGGLGVAVFFALSGYLVAGSYFADPHFGRFMVRRILRIFPGLAVCVLLTVFVAGVWFTTLDIKTYLTDERTWNYLKTLVLHVKYELPGVFEANPYPKAVNGSLWTIPLEFKCYVVLALVCWVVRGYRVRILLFAVFWGVGFYLYQSLLKSQKLEFTSLYPLAFCAGVSYRAADVVKRKLAIPVIVLMLISLFLFPQTVNMGHMLLIAVIVVGIGSTIRIHVPQLLQRNDISYGVYLYAFVVQQAVYSTGMHQSYFWGAFMLVVVLTTFFAVLSCRFVEQPMLDLSPNECQ